MLVFTAFQVISSRSLFVVVMLSGVFSFLSALLMLAMDAADVAFTEAAVGAGISTVLMLATLALTSRVESFSMPINPIPILIVILTGLALIYGTLDMPDFGSSGAPAQIYLATEYLERIPREIGFPNAVTAILASYRGYDTFGEIIVVFTAGIGVSLLMRKSKNQKLVRFNSQEEDKGRSI